MRLQNGHRGSQGEQVVDVGVFKIAGGLGECVL